MLPFPCRIRYLIRGEHQIALFVAVVLRYAQFIPAGAADIERVFIPLLSGGGLENAPRTLFAPRPVPPDPHRDRAQMLKVENVQQAWQQWINKLPPARREDEDVKEIRWMIEELRVSYFAQQLGTPYPISDKRILQAMEQISG